MNRTKFVTKEEAEKNKRYFILDAAGKTLGRFASEVSKILRGKHKPTFTPNADTGDGVIIINAEKIKVTGSKEARKVYIRYTGWVGGLRKTPYSEMQDKNPEFIIEHAVKGMMPRKSKLTRKQLKRLRIFKGEEHNMQAQKPIAVNI
jgi:large subunit ribosomal protein L13